MAATAMVMGLGGGGSLTHRVSVGFAATATIGGQALDPVATAITATASDGTSNCAVSDATAIKALASGRAGSARPIAAMSVNSVAALAASSAVPTVAVACHGGIRTSVRDAAVRAEVFAHCTNPVPVNAAREHRTCEQALRCWFGCHAREQCARVLLEVVSVHTPLSHVREHGVVFDPELPRGRAEVV